MTAVLFTRVTIILSDLDIKSFAVFFDNTRLKGYNSTEAKKLLYVWLSGLSILVWSVPFSKTWWEFENSKSLKFRNSRPQK